MNVPRQAVRLLTFLVVMALAFAAEAMGGT